MNETYIKRYAINVANCFLRKKATNNCFFGKSGPKKEGKRIPGWHKKKGNRKYFPGENEFPHIKRRLGDVTFAGKRVRVL